MNYKTESLLGAALLFGFLAVLGVLFWVLTPAANAEATGPCPAGETEMLYPVNHGYVTRCV